jgi:hypothetical protein
VPDRLVVRDPVAQLHDPIQLPIHDRRRGGRLAQMAWSMLLRQATSNQPINSNRAALARQFQA